MSKKLTLFSTIQLLLIMIFNVSIESALAIDYEKIPTADHPVLEDHYPPRETKFDQGVKGLADVIYADVDGFQPLKLDLYLPPETNDKSTLYPVILMVHGGGWFAGHSRHSGAFSNWPETMASIAAEGYVVASINYRLSGEAPFPAAIQDLKSSILFLRANAETYRIDPTRIVTWGGSAGGQLAALAAAACKVDELFPVAKIPGLANNAEYSDCIQGAVVWYGVFDFSNLVAQPPVMAYLDCDENCPEENVRLASAMTVVDSSAPPFLLIHGIEDPVVSVEQSENFHTRLEKIGINSKLLLIPEVKHSFIGENAVITREASLTALKASIEFINDIVGK